MAEKTVHLPVVGLGATLRKDAWWAGPAVTVTVLLCFIAYATFRLFENAHYQYDAYLSPFYAPLIDASFTRGWGLPFTVSPAMLVLGGPLSFRFTCYYYRKAYYRAFAMDPPACSVGEPTARKDYRGETRLMVFQNLHRFALYLAIAFLVFLWHDALKAIYAWSDGVHVGVGTLIMLVNCALLSGYTFGCHSFRHLIGGSVDSYSTAPLGMLRHKLWRGVSALNARHMQFAWASLVSVALTDVYIRAVASGAIRDLRLF